MENLCLPMVECFQTVEGEGKMAGTPTTFVRVYNCNLRCRWCDTPYSYAPEHPSYFSSIGEILEQVKSFGHGSVCLTGGEPLMHGEKSLALVKELSLLPEVWDVHVETNGSIPLHEFIDLRSQDEKIGKTLRFIVDYKLPSSGEEDQMDSSTFSLLQAQDEVKFVVANDDDFHRALEVIKNNSIQADLLFSPVWDTMPPHHLVELLLAHRPHGGRARLNLQLHKMIWDPDMRGV